MDRSLIQPLFDGPLDIVGDVHGEIEALRSLMQHLGYDDAGSHPEGRHSAYQPAIRGVGRAKAGSHLPNRSVPWQEAVIPFALNP